MTTSPIGTQDINLIEIRGIGVDTGLGHTDTGTQRVTISDDTTIDTIRTINTVTTITDVVHIDDNSNSLTIDNETLTEIGGGDESRALRVTIANDSTGLLSVDDNNGSLTVDGVVTLEAGSAFIGLISGAVQATLNTETTKVIGVVGISGAIPAGTNVIGHVIADTGSTTVVTGTVTVDSELTTADLDTGAGTDTRAVVGIAGAASGGAVLVQATAAGALKEDITTIAGTAPTTAGKLDVKGADGDIFVRQATASNLNAMIVGTGTLAVQATVAAGATNIAKAEDVASADADVGVPALAVRKATPANTSSTDGDYEFIQMSAGRLWTSTTIDTALPAGTNVIGHIIADTGSTTAVTGNVTVVQATGTNLHAVLDTTSTTAVTQATAANLNAAVVGTGTAGAPAGNILTIQGVASMTKLLVTPDSVALPANQSVNVAQIAGTSTVTGGVAGIIAVGGNIANAVAATANPVPVGGIFTTTPATLTTGQTATRQFTAAQNAKNDTTTLGGVAISLNTGVRDTGTQRVTIATNDVVPVTDNAGSLTVDNAGTFAVQPAGSVAHDGVGTGVNPVLVGGYASAAAPTDVSADGDAVREWHLRNGAGATVITAAGALIGGDAANGLDVDVTRLPALVAGAALIGKVGIDQTTVGTTNAVSIAQLGANTVSTGNGTAGTGTLRVAVASDNTAFQTKPIASATATQKNSTVSTSAVLVIASNANRLKCSLVNNSVGNAYVGFANTVTTTGATQGQLMGPSGGSWEPPAGINYTGDVYVIYDIAATTQNIAGVEYTA